MSPKMICCVRFLVKRYISEQTKNTKAIRCKTPGIRTTEILNLGKSERNKPNPKSFKERIVSFVSVSLSANLP